MFIFLLAMAQSAGPTRPCLPDPAELSRRPAASASSPARPFNKAVFKPSPELLRVSLSNPPPVFEEPLEPCDPNARTQRGVVPPGSGARP